MALPPLIGRQKEVLALPAQGHTVVLGTAGSGKTTLAVYRSAFLAHPSTARGGRTLLLTFNNTLVTYLRHLADPSDPALLGFADVQVETYHKFARGYLASQGIRGRFICNQWCRPPLVAQAVRQVSRRFSGHPLFDRPVVFFEDEIAWISQHGFTSPDAYNDAERLGRARARLPRGEQRSMVYDVLSEYRRRRTEAGYRCDYDDIASHVREALSTDDSPRRYRHMVIDEGQDFSPEMMRSLAGAVPEDGSVTFFGDMAQQIYGQRLSWRSAGLNVPGIWEFKENYRNTSQIARLALAISRMPFFSGVPDLVEPTSPTADGPLPTLVQLASREAEAELVARQAADAARTRSVAILVRNWADAAPIRQQLSRSVITLDRDLRAWSIGAGIRIGTYHSAKGLEFDTVILPFLSTRDLPDPRIITAAGEEQARTQDGKLLYVAVTRARTQLLMTYSGTLTSLLPAEEGIYLTVTR